MTKKEKQLFELLIIEVLELRNQALAWSDNAGYFHAKEDTLENLLKTTSELETIAYNLA